MILDNVQVHRDKSQSLGKSCVPTKGFALKLSDIGINLHEG